MIITAETTLRDEGEAAARKLIEAGVQRGLRAGSQATTRIMILRC